MAKRYIRINWENRPSVATPMNATNLNIMDKGIDDIDTALENHINAMVQTDTVNDATKYPSSAVTYVHGQEIDALNNNLAELDPIAFSFTANANVCTVIVDTSFIIGKTIHVNVAINMIVDTVASGAELVAFADSMFKSADRFDFAINSASDYDGLAYIPFGESAIKANSDLSGVSGRNLFVLGTIRLL